jgi:hypothetical protein
MKQVADGLQPGTGVPDAEAAIPAEAAFSGYVEGFGTRDVWGWVAGPVNAPGELQLRCGGRVTAVLATWVPRPDVVAVVGELPGLRGFQFRVPYEVARRLRDEPALVSETVVLFDGEALPFAAGVVPVAAGSGQWSNFPFESTLPAKGGRRLPVQVWTESPFRIRCRVAGAVLQPSDLGLLCNGEPVDPMAMVFEETAEVDGHEAVVATVCEFTLPGWLWEGADADLSRTVQFTFNGKPFPDVPVTLTARDAIDWLGMQERSGTRETFDLMLAIEHAHFCGARLPLSPGLAAFLQQAASQYGLSGYLRLSADASALPPPAEVELTSILLWQALRDFNRRLVEYAGREDRLLESAEADWPQGVDKAGFIESLVPLFCRLGSFDAIRQRVSAQHLEKLVASRQAWTSSIALPFLVAGEQVDWAADMLYSLRDMPGWINTECVAEASRQIVERARGEGQFEKFAYGIIGLLESLSADYWSRLHDVQLIESLAVWMERPVYWNRWLWDDLQAAALKFYGFSPVFWARVAPSLEGGDPLHSRLVAAHAAFRRLQAFVATRPADELPAVMREDLRLFVRSGCRDAVQVLRELTVRRALDAEDINPVVESLPLQELLAYGDTEIVRFAALPVADDRALLDRMPGLPDVIAGMHEGIGRSSRHPLQLRLGQSQRRIWSIAETKDKAAVYPAVQSLLRDVKPFDDAASQYLAADCLARAWATLANVGGASMLAPVLARQIVQGLSVGSAQRWPDQPVLSALALFRSGVGATGEAILQSYLRQIDQQLEVRCGADHASVIAALAAPKKLQLRGAAGHDTLLVIYSCRKYLDTRVKAIRESWLKDLRTLGVPYVILVGDGDNALNGDVLELAVSDRYEDLPAKTLAMIRWVVENTDFQYAVKIDDDCLLDVDAYFNSLSYRKFHYYGRILRRPIGGTDRRWHQSKSQSALARRAIDKSPEPSVYADGGGGYSLSRLAMTQVLLHASTPWGQRLCATSFMEDKLVGDLLSWSGIAVENEDYYTLVRRRYGSNAQPVCVFDNTFAPSRSSPVKLAHLDTDADMSPVRARRDQPGLWPKKIWPTYLAPSLRSDSNQLELITDERVARNLLREDFFVVAVMRNEQVMLPHFLAHYRRLGCRAFIIVDNLSDDGTRETLLAQPDVVLYSADTQYGKSTYGVAWQQAVLANHCISKWALVADADELLVYPDQETRPIAEVLAQLDAGGFDAACVYMVDMYPFGDLADADLTKSDPFAAARWFDAEPFIEWRLSQGAYSNAPNHVSALRHRLMPAAEPNAFTSQKYCLLRYAPWMRVCAGLHDIANANVSPDPLHFAHFKYHAGFKAKVEEEVARKQHFGGAQEYRKYQSLLAEGRGGFGVEGVSLEYAGSGVFARAMPRK